MPAALKALILWLSILVLAIVNGMLREQVLIPTLGSFGGLLLSGVILMACIFFVAWLAVPWWGALTAKQCWSIGAFWLLLTLAFEFVFGRFVQGRTLSELMEAYSFAGGNLWSLVLLFVFVSPRLAARIRGAL